MAALTAKSLCPSCEVAYLTLHCPNTNRRCDCLLCPNPYCRLVVTGDGKRMFNVVKPEEGQS